MERVLDPWGKKGEEGRWIHGGKKGEGKEETYLVTDEAAADLAELRVRRRPTTSTRRFPCCFKTFA